MLQDCGVVVHCNVVFYMNTEETCNPHALCSPVHILLTVKRIISYCYYY